MNEAHSTLGRARRLFPPLAAIALCLILGDRVQIQEAQAQEFELFDLGANGTTNQTWSISQTGFVAGYSQLGPNTEGFVHDDDGLVFVGIPSGTTRSDMLGINDFGHAVGKAGTTHENGEALLWVAGGPLESLGTLGGSRSAAVSINNGGQIVGWSKLEGDEQSRPFLYEDGVMTPLLLLGGTQGQADWINSQGQIVGGSTNDTDGLQQFAVIWEDGLPTRLPPIHAGENNLANYIHDNGDIAGSVRIPDEDGFIRRAAIWRDTEIHQVLGTLADGSGAEAFATSWASGVNSRGEIIGMSVNEASALVPFLYRDGEMIELSALMPEPWIANFVGSGAINDLGQIAVSGFVPQGTTRALLLTPITTSSGETEYVVDDLSLTVQGQRIEYDLASAGSIEVTLYDLLGRKVHSLDRGWKPAGSYRIDWNGRSARGRETPAGVYFVRIETPNSERTARLVRIR